jgi:hypothetical protein
MKEICSTSGCGTMTGRQMPRCEFNHRNAMAELFFEDADRG